MSIWHFQLDLPAEIYIETGVHVGETMQNAVNSNKFKKLIGIECDNTNFMSSKQRFDPYPNVKIIKGNSLDILPRILEANKKTLFWLDAHYCGHGMKNLMVQSAGECPLMGELEIITKQEWEILPTILIDDPMMFYHDKWDKRLKEDFDMKQWPTIKQIEQILDRWTVQEYVQKFHEIDEPSLLCLPEI